MTQEPTPPTGRRVATTVARGPDITVVLAVLLPLLMVGGLLLVRPDQQGSEPESPTRTDLTRATIVCPSGAAQTSLSTLSESSGEVAVRRGRKLEETTATLTPRAITTVSGDGPVVVVGEGELAPGLIGGVFDSPLAAAPCSDPTADQWFTGVGAGARHGSVLELVNPDAGPAVVDTTLFGQDGLVDAPALRGVAVPAHGVVRIDLATTIPRRDELTLRVTTSRGRVAATVRDKYDQLGAGAAARDWMSAQPEPATSNLMLGLVSGSGQRNLVLTNPGSDETRATVQVITKNSVFTPKGVEDVVVTPELVKRVSLSKLLPKDALREAVGLLVTSPAPITATVRSFVDGDLSHAVPGAAVTSSAVLTPTGAKQLMLAGASSAGTVTIVGNDASGERVMRRRVDITANRGYVVAVSPQVTSIEITATGSSIVGSVLVTGNGAAVVPLTDLVRDSLIAQVRPGL